MTERLKNFVAGSWVSGTDPRAELLNPATEAVVATASAAGVDVPAALEYARQTGGPALRALSFKQRGALLAAMSRVIHREREHLIEIGMANGGNTRGDAKFDIDGASGTLMSYATLGEQLGDAQLLADAPAQDLVGARIQGLHVLSPRHGVAVHIGAFNFPAWGWAEKAACALLAGMPVLTKPATATSWLAHRSIELVLNEGILPAGALSLVCGSAHDLPSHLQWNDVVAFTGGSATALKIRGDQSVLARGARVNIEADSLNAALLVPGAGDAAFHAFVRDVVRDMTQKAGQKCTAIRRVIVPESELEKVTEALVGELERIKVGDPTHDQVNMGPLATAAQKRDVLAGIAKLREQVELVFGDPSEPQALGVKSGQGFFVPPVLLRAADSLAASHVHDHEVFGPVATLLPYDGTAEHALAIVRAGMGGLVASIYGDDREFLSAAVTGALGWHGRLVVVDSKIAEKSLAPGMVLPELVHGGPGRAGGGEELGGQRGMRFYQQRTAVQGNGPLIARLLGLR